MRLAPLLDVKKSFVFEIWGVERGRKKKREWGTERRKRETQKGFRFFLVGPFTNSSFRKVGRVGRW
jgi:hypothetical protein